MPYADNLPFKAQIFGHWKDRFQSMRIFIDWGEPSCWACGFHYGAKYDIKSSNASLSKILDGWNRIPFQRCHIIPRSLGGGDEPANLFLMCRECHDLQPNTTIQDAFFKWVRAQSCWRREATKIEEAFQSFGVAPEEQLELIRLLESSEFKLG